MTWWLVYVNIFTENWDEWAGGETEEQNEEDYQGDYQEDYQEGYEPHADDPDFCVSHNILYHLRLYSLFYLCFHLT